MDNSYPQQGFVVVKDLLDPELLATAREETTAICRGQRGRLDGLTDTVPLCVHFPHKVSPLMRGLARLPAIVEVLTSVIGPNIKMMQSMLFIKPAGKPGQAWHQDEAHIPTRDRSLTAAWIALDDATVHNGCLWVIPGSHRPGVLHPVREQHDARFDCTDEAYDFGYRPSDAVPVELPAGAALIFNGYLLHRSLPNTTTGTRRALVNHYMSAESLLPWLPPGPADTMALLDHRDIELIAGADPYAHRGTTDLMHPHLRPDGDGGCVRG
jgi:phytanoyl-CoA hydroxylase